MIKKNLPITKQKMMKYVNDIYDTEAQNRFSNHSYQLHFIMTYIYVYIYICKCTYAFAI